MAESKGESSSRIPGFLTIRYKRTLCRILDVIYVTGNLGSFFIERIGRPGKFLMSWYEIIKFNHFSWTVSELLKVVYYYKTILFFSILKSIFNYLKITPTFKLFLLPRNMVLIFYRHCSFHINISNVPNRQQRSYVSFIRLVFLKISLNNL